jgi:hypothetical protein
MKRDQWNKLDTTAKTIWDSLPDEAKAIILDRKPSNHTPHRPRYTANPYEMLAHDLLSSLFIGNTTETNTTSTGTNANDNNKDSKDSNPILTMLTQQRTSFAANQQDKKHPGDITRMMSTSNDKKPPSLVVIDGNTYLIKMHRITETNNANGKITYQASSASSQQGGALIDRGSNGGVAGDNVRVIHIDPHRTMNVEGIDNRQISNIRRRTC